MPPTTNLEFFAAGFVGSGRLHSANQFRLGGYRAASQRRDGETMAAALRRRKGTHQRGRSGDSILVAPLSPSLGSGDVKVRWAVDCVEIISDGRNERKILEKAGWEMKKPRMIEPAINSADKEVAKEISSETYGRFTLTQTGFGAGAGHAGEHPIRQPLGPPPIEELKAKPTTKFAGSKNFATFSNLSPAGSEHRNAPLYTPPKTPYVSPEGTPSTIRTLKAEELSAVFALLDLFQNERLHSPSSSLKSQKNIIDERSFSEDIHVQSEVSGQNGSSEKQDEKSVIEATILMKMMRDDSKLRQTAKKKGGATT
ncbi:hypothetical protein NHQ30_004651 [Ciborinia camelliae]|nr:hypothetical protein NHQ30_004651 [Ciborinia camelliae]